MNDTKNKYVDVILQITAEVVIPVPARIKDPLAYAKAAVSDDPGWFRHAPYCVDVVAVRET